MRSIVTIGALFNDTPKFCTVPVKTPLYQPWHSLSSRQLPVAYLVDGFSNPTGKCAHRVRRRARRKSCGQRRSMKPTQRTDSGRTPRMCAGLPTTSSTDAGGSRLLPSNGPRVPSIIHNRRTSECISRVPKCERLGRICNISFHCRYRR
jgi:hypothetical protein